MSRHAGFTLIELLVSLVILSTGIVLVLGALETSAAALSQARVMSRSVFLAEQRLAAVSLDAMSGGSAAGNAASGAFAEPFTRYEWEQRVSNEGDAVGGLPGLNQVSVLISHADVDRESFRLVTVLAVP